MGIFEEEVDHDLRTVVATFIANDEGVARKFVQELVDTDEHMFEFDEYETDKFYLIWLPIFGNYEEEKGEVMELIHALSPGDCIMKGVFEFKVFKGGAMIGTE